MRLFLVSLILMVGCCATPVADYVEADAAAWKQIDKHLERWIDADPRLKPIEKEALKALNLGRRARIEKAIDATRSSE